MSVVDLSAVVTGVPVKPINVAFGRESLIYFSVPYLETNSNSFVFSFS